MIKMIVKHEVAVEEREYWMNEFKNKKVIREACGISQDINPIVYPNGREEIIVIHEVKAPTIQDAIKVLNHIKANSTSRRIARAKGDPLFSE